MLRGGFFKHRKNCFVSVQETKRSFNLAFTRARVLQMSTWCSHCSGRSRRRETLTDVQWCGSFCQVLTLAGKKKRGEELGTAPVPHVGKPDVVPVKLWIRVTSLKKAKKNGRETQEQLLVRRDTIADELDLLEERYENLKRYYQLQQQVRGMQNDLQRDKRIYDKSKEMSVPFNAMAKIARSFGESDPGIKTQFQALLFPLHDYIISLTDGMGKKMSDLANSEQELQTLANELGLRFVMTESSDAIESLLEKTTASLDELLEFIVEFSVRYNELGERRVGKVVEPVVPVEEQQQQQQLVPLSTSEEGIAEVSSGLTKNQAYVFMNCTERARKFSEAVGDLVGIKEAVRYVQESDIVLHLPLVTLLPTLVAKRDIYIRNLFETRKNQGHGTIGGRVEWEEKIFASPSYNALTPHEKVKYGALNLARSPGGIPSVKKYGYGACHVVFNNEVKKRCTLTYRDSSYASVSKIATFLHPQEIVREIYNFSQNAYLYMVDQKGANPFDSPHFEYTEVQIHGELRWDRDIAAVHVPRDISTDVSFLADFDAFCQILGVQLPLVAYDSKPVKLFEWPVDSPSDDDDDDEDSSSTSW